MDGRKINLSAVIRLPDEVVSILAMLEEAGYEGFCVGGCIRDSLLGLAPEDWDITTSALPQQVMEVFSDFTIIPTGIEHGTVTLRMNHKSFEITTYRVDGEYSDHRRPDTVHFTSRIQEDLARRDFSMNAIAYNPSRGLVDPFGGQKDIIARKITCVGVPEERFEEDPLRIVRAFRFVSVLGFVVDSGTEQAMHAYVDQLALVAPERIAVELNKALVGQNIQTALEAYAFVLFEIMPELQAMVDFPQNTPYHIYDVWTHTIESVRLAPNDLVVRLTMLLHDSGKPEAHTVDEQGTSHFHGHGSISVTIAHTILRRLRYSNALRGKVEQLVKYHDLRFEPTLKAVRRVLRRQGADFFPYYLEVRRADTRAQAPAHQQEELERLDQAEALYQEILEEQQCFSIAQLAVNGNDLISIGIVEGRDIGEWLDRLVTLVIDEKISNEKEALLDYVYRQL